MTNGTRRRGNVPAVTILCYHSWNIGIEHLAADILHLRSSGWTAISLDELLKLRRGEASFRDKLFHVTNDDASPYDEPFARELERLECPGSFYVATGLIPPERRQHYQSLDRGGLIAVEDHSLMHRKRFRTPRLIEFWSERARTTGLSEGDLVDGSPVVETGSELAGPLFTIAPEVTHACQNHAVSVRPARDPVFYTDMTTLLVKQGLAVRQRDGFNLKGTFEAPERYWERIERELSEGRERFTSLFGRHPRVFCYPFFQTSAHCEVVLSRLGYELTLAGGSRSWRGEHPAPRVSIDNDTARPIDLIKMCHISLRSRARGSIRRILTRARILNGQ